MVENMKTENNIELNKDTFFRKHKKPIIGVTLSVAIVASTFGIVGFKYFNKFEVKEKIVTLELGETLDQNIKNYLDASKRVLTSAKIDFTTIDQTKIGSYDVIATYKDKKVTFKVEIKDTKAPEVVVQDVDTLKVIVGRNLLASSVIKEMSDIAGISSVVFDKNQVEIATESTEILDKTGLKFDATGAQEVIVTVTDINGNKTEQPLTITVIEDYEAHVTGIDNLTVEQSSTIDWLAGITKDEKVPEIRVNADGVDINTPGEYKLIYTIIGDDTVTTIEKEVTVTVVEPAKAQELANSGTAVKTTGGTKPQAQAKSSGKNYNSGNGSSGGTSSGSNKPSGGSSSGSNKPSGGSSSGSNKPSGGGSSSGGSSEWKPGQGWEGDKTDEGYTSDGGVYGESGTWNPWG